MSPNTVPAVDTYYHRHAGVGMLRFGLGALQAAWPGLAARAATRLFLTPLPPKWAQRGKALGVEWSVESWPFEEASLTIYRRREPAVSPTALLVHGWGGYAGQMVSLAHTLAGRGWNPVLLEMPGHGRSGGWQSNLPQFTRAIDYVAARLVQEGRQLGALIGHSLGGTAAAFVVSRGTPFTRLALIAPAASPPAYTRLFAQVFGIREDVRAAMQHRIEAKEGILMPQFEPLSVGLRIAVPTLVVHDRHDPVNRFADGQAFAQAVRQAELFATEGLGHRKILQAPPVLDHVASFVSAAPAPQAT